MIFLKKSGCKSSLQKLLLPSQTDGSEAGIFAPGAGTLATDFPLRASAHPAEHFSFTENTVSCE